MKQFVPKHPNVNYAHIHNSIYQRHKFYAYKTKISLYHNLSFIQLIQRIFYVPDTLLGSEDIIINKREVYIK